MALLAVTAVAASPPTAKAVGTSAVKQDSLAVKPLAVEINLSSYAFVFDSLSILRSTPAPIAVVDTGGPVTLDTPPAPSLLRRPPSPQAHAAVQYAMLNSSHRPTSASNAFAGHRLLTRQ